MSERKSEKNSIGENQDQNLKETKIRAFQDEIAEIRRQEQTREIETVHLTNPRFNPDELNEEDMAIWEKIKEGSIEETDWDSYRREFVDPQTKRFKPTISISRHIFLAFIANKANPIFLRKSRENSQ